ncbi:DUF4177 domain-containing protein [Candidatus Woesearchaeota archaeon]|nr:DUF4177 domain-containing protein [Candidatus Woesearchaeota archaeon]
MTKWEYKLVDVGKTQGAETLDFVSLKESLLNEYGKEGWELINIIGKDPAFFEYVPPAGKVVLVFKRKIEE